MNIFRKRPLLLALFIFTFCCVVSSILPPICRIFGVLTSLFLFVLFTLTTVILAILKYRYRQALFTVTLCTCFAFIAFFSSHKFFDNKLLYVETLGEENDVVAEIQERTYSASYLTVYTAKITSINGEKTNFKASISSYDAIYLEVGEVIISNMSFAPFSVTEYGYDARMSNISNGILTSATFEDARILNIKPEFDIVSLFNKLRNYIADIVEQKFDTTAPIIKALLIGDQDDIDAVTKYNFSRLGISHILSISGTHFTVLLGMIAVLLSLLGLNKRVVYVILIPIALFYIGLSGFSFPVCRAGIMAFMSYWGFLCGRERDSYTSLFISVAIILITAPYAVLSISFWLSFTATFTILIVLELFTSKLLVKDLPWYRMIINYILTHSLITVAISFSTLPIVALYFGYVSLASPIANLLIVPMFEVFLYIIPFGVALSNFSLPVAITEAYGNKLLWIVEEFASIDNLLIAVNQKFVIIIACIGVLATLILIAIPLKKKFIITLPSIICVIIISIGLLVFYKARYDETFVTYFNTGISDTIVVTDTNKTMCIDITNGSSASIYYTQAMVKESYSTKISAYVFTHYRSDHINAFEKLASRIEIQKAYLPIAKDGKSAEYMRSVASAAQKHDIEIVYFDYGVPFQFEECEVTVFEPQFISRTSHEIISVYISTYKDDLLYLGSSFSEGKLDFSAYAKDAEYIIFGQHYPKIKNRFYIDTDATLIYGNGDIYSKSDIAEEGCILSDGDRYYFSLK